MCIFAVEVCAALAHPAYHAGTAELVAAIALSEAAGFIGFGCGVALGACSEHPTGSGFGVTMDNSQAAAVCRASLVYMLWSITINTDFEGAVLASKDTAVCFTVEMLREPRATIHANEPGRAFEFCGVSRAFVRGRMMLIWLIQLACSSLLYVPMIRPPRMSSLRYKTCTLYLRVVLLLVEGSTMPPSTVRRHALNPRVRARDH